ncbi:MAG: hypothetical protein ACXWCC_17770, partial [Caldimonas sp.]
AAGSVLHQPLAQAQAWPQAHCVPQAHCGPQAQALRAAGCWQPQVQVLPWHTAQLQGTGCFASFMVRFLAWLDDGMSSMTVTVVERSRRRKPFATNRRLRSCSGRWHRPNGARAA